jgi:hypothetical protein
MRRENLRLMLNRIGRWIPIFGSFHLSTRRKDDSDDEGFERPVLRYKRRGRELAAYLCASAFCVIGALCALGPYYLGATGPLSLRRAREIREELGIATPTEQADFLPVDLDLDLDLDLRSKDQKWLKFDCKPNCTRRCNAHIVDVRIAVYSHSFGNFRGEADKIENASFDEGFEYFFATDNMAMTSKNWKFIRGVPDVIKKMNNITMKHTENEILSRWRQWKFPLPWPLQIPAGPPVPLSLPRLASKYFKWKHLPDVLRSFDYVFHVDASSINGYKPRNLTLPTKAELQLLTQIYPNTCLFLLAHPDRNSVYQELWWTLYVDVEDRVAGKAWWSELKSIGFKDKWPLVETRMYLRRIRGCEDVDQALGAVFDTLVSRGLHRDQNVFGVVAPRSLNLHDDQVKVIGKHLWHPKCTLPMQDGLSAAFLSRNRSRH